MTHIDHGVLKILVADDSSTVRHFVVNAVKMSGFASQITQAEDGETCLEQLSSGEFDMAFIDVNMPGMSGMDAVARSREVGANSFNVIMSTETDPEKLKLARELGAYAYLAKPFGEDEVASIIRNYVRFSKSSSVLLVDDSRAMRAVIKRVLHNSIFKLTIDEAENGASALSMYQSAGHDIVFLDMNMPGLNGIDTLSMLRKLNEDVKVVLITTTQGRKMVETLEDGSFASVLYKPFFPADVDRALHALFGLWLPSFGDEARETSVENADAEELETVYL